MKICKTCVLPESFPGIVFDENGICSYCYRFKGTDNQKKQKERFKQKFLEILEEQKGKGPYDALVAYSGGKDSTYTLRLLKENFGLKVLAVTFDHGFVSPEALKNIRNVTEALDIDGLTVHQGGKTICDVFVKSLRPKTYPVKSLERASSICNSCMNLTKSFFLKTAIEMRVPLVAYGWSPGQAPLRSSVLKTNAVMILQMQKVMKKIFKKMVGDRLSGFFLQEHHFDLAESSKKDLFPYLIHPLAFLNYDEEEIVSNIKDLNWVYPKDTDSNSTNCLLNGFANQVHIEQHGFHPYSFEIATLVREGYMTRKDGLKKLSIPPDPKVVEYVKKKLGIEEISISEKAQNDFLQGFLI
jgi:tRNA(Ile)-lysidine synthase TilS/MesJ